nr:hypothetical protein [Tanacetum cinerariifolium]
MDTIIPLGQKNNLAEYMILSGADNRPPMLDKNLYDSWKSKIELYMQNREHERMILESVENGPLIWPTVEENGVTRIKKYDELSVAEKIQTDCDMKATNIIFQDIDFSVPIFSQRDDLIACLNKAMAFLSAVASSKFPLTNNQLRTSSNLRNQAFKMKGLQCNKFREDKTEDLNTYDSDRDDISNAKAVLVDNISNYGSDVILEIPHSETYLNDMKNQ